MTEFDDQAVASVATDTDRPDTKYLFLDWVYISSQLNKCINLTWCIKCISPYRADRPAAPIDAMIRHRNPRHHRSNDVQALPSDKWLIWRSQGLLVRRTKCDATVAEMTVHRSACNAKMKIKSFGSNSERVPSFTWTIDWKFLPVCVVYIYCHPDLSHR